MSHKCKRGKHSDCTVLDCPCECHYDPTTDESPAISVQTLIAFVSYGKFSQDLKLK